MPEVGMGDSKFKVIMDATGKLPTSKWVQLYRIEIFGLYKDYKTPKIIQIP